MTTEIHLRDLLEASAKVAEMKRRLLEFEAEQAAYAEALLACPADVLAHLADDEGRPLADLLIEWREAAAKKGGGK